MCSAISRNATLSHNLITNEASTWVKLPLSSTAIALPLRAASSRGSQQSNSGTPLPLEMTTIKNQMLAIPQTTEVPLSALLPSSGTVLVPEHSRVAVSAGASQQVAGGGDAAARLKSPSGLAMLLRGAAELDTTAPLKCLSIIPSLMSGAPGLECQTEHTHSTPSLNPVNFCSIDLSLPHHCP